MAFHYYLFDLDGTLTDPGIGITNSVMYALNKYRIQVTDRTLLYPFIGPPLKDSFMKYYGFSEGQAMEAIEYYREYFRAKGMYENQVYAGIPEVLSTLKSRGAKLLLATSKPEEFSIAILKHFHLYDYFDYIGAATMDEKRNRKEDVIAHTLENFGISDHTEVIMVGDRHQDIYGAKVNGITSAGVLYGYGDYAELSEAGADFILNKPEELLAL